MAPVIPVLLVLLVCIAAWGLWRPVASVSEKVLRQGVYPAAGGLLEAFRALPRIRASEEQREALLRDGAVVLPGAVRDPAVLHVLSTAWGTAEARAEDWFVNGILRAFLRDGPLGELASSCLNGSAVRIFSSGVFAVPGGYPGGYVPPGPPHGGVHVDLDSTVGYLVPLLTVWLALTNAKRPVEFLPGSHLANLRHDCPYGPELNLSDGCIAKLLAEAGDRRLGWDVRAGDALVFFSQTYHWAVLQAEERTALSFRFVAADQRMDFQDHYLTTKLPCALRPRWCAPMGDSSLFPVVHPRENSTVDEVPFPVFERRVDVLCKLLPMPDPGGFGKELCPQ